MKTQKPDDLIFALKARYEKNMHRHKGIAWAEVQARIESNPKAVKSLRAMEETGGEPDVIGQDKETGHFTFCDCSTESPTGRRSVCYDREAWTRGRRTSRRAVLSRWLSQSASTY